MFNINRFVDEILINFNSGRSIDYIAILFTLFATQALNAIGNRSIFFSVSISGTKSPTSTRLAIAKYLSFSSETRGLMVELNIVVYSNFFP